MFDFLKSGGTPGSGPPGNKEMSVETRLLLAFILMGAVLFTTPYFFKTPPTPATTAKKVEPGAVAPAPAQVAEQPPVPAAAAASSPGQIGASREETFALDTDLYHIVFWNRGAVVQSWTLKKYKDSANKPLEVVNTAGASVTGFPFSLGFKNQKPSVDLNNVLYAAKRS